MCILFDNIFILCMQPKIDSKKDKEKVIISTFSISSSISNLLEIILCRYSKIHFYSYPHEMIHHYCKEVSIHSSFVRIGLIMQLDKAYVIIEWDQDNIQLCIKRKTRF